MFGLLNPFNLIILAVVVILVLAAFNIGGVRDWLLNEINVESIIRIVIGFLKNLLINIWNFLYDFLKVVANTAHKVLVEELQKLFGGLREKIFKETVEDINNEIIPQQ